MQQIIGVRREDLSKTGEKRVAISPETARLLLSAGHQLLVQPAIHPEQKINKRAFQDDTYAALGAKITEDLNPAQIIFGLKEVETQHLLPGKTYLFFSHTHKGQVKNRPLLQAMVEKSISLIDYELITDEANRRIVTAFTYFAGYAGMTDTLWALGQRWQQRGIESALTGIPQSVAREDLDLIKADIRAAGERIARNGTPATEPPLITVFLGAGKTSAGAQEMYQLLPLETITLAELPEVYAKGDRRKVYALVLDIPDMYRFRADSPYFGETLGFSETFDLYLHEPQHFESNLDRVFPYITLLMNCILWGPKYPRLLSREDTRAWYRDHQTLQVVGDITCDPEGAIQFSQETWIDQPVFVYNPKTEETTLGFAGEGIAVMAVTNLPCEFPADASNQFSRELATLIEAVAAANHKADSPGEAGLPDAIRKATILWKGEFTPDYTYMQEYLPG